MYINLFENRYLANGLARKTKTSCTACFFYKNNNKGCLIIKVGMGKTNLKIFSKNLQEEENMT